MEKIEADYPRGCVRLLIYVKIIFDIIANEPALLPKSMMQIIRDMVLGRCILALVSKKLVGYVATIPYKKMKLAKVSSHVVEFDSRENGIGSKLAKEIYDLSKKLYPQCKVITVVDPENARKFERLGMVRIDKHDVPKEFIDTTSIDLNIDTPNKIIMIEL